MSKSNADRLNELYKKYSLTGEDIFKSPQGWVIITRSGIDKIQAGAGVKISYELVGFEPDNWAAVKATGVAASGETIETFGEATPKTTRQPYKLAMAEKRAMSRAVLKLTGFYEAGAFGEDEADDFGAEAKNNRLKTLQKQVDES